MVTKGSEREPGTVELGLHCGAVGPSCLRDAAIPGGCSTISFCVHLDWFPRSLPSHAEPFDFSLAGRPQVATIWAGGVPSSCLSAYNSGYHFTMFAMGLASLARCHSCWFPGNVASFRICGPYEAWFATPWRFVSLAGCILCSHSQPQDCSIC